LDSNTKEDILNCMEDLVADFLYYDRKEDEDLPVGVIQQAIKNGELTFDEVVERFTHELANKWNWECDTARKH
jgi:hypothetical protein